MPFQQRLTWDGIALHAGGLPGYPESHGCVHLPYDFSRELFGVTTLGATVVIADAAADHVRSSATSLIAPVDAHGAAAGAPAIANGEYVWEPWRAPKGPLTIIVSKADQRVVFLRNGIEIDRSLAHVNDDDTSSHLITPNQSASGIQRWSYVGLPGHVEDAGRDLDEATINRLRLPRRFYEQVKAQLTPGATILITQSSVGDDGKRGRITIMDAVVPRP